MEKEERRLAGHAGIPLKSMFNCGFQVELLNQHKPRVMRKIAAKVLKRINKFNASKVIDLDVYKHQKKHTEDLFSQVMTTEQAIEKGHDPLHAIYIHVQNLLSVLAETLQEIPEPSLDRFFKIIDSASDNYQPSSPPMSPLTTSYFNCWLLFDISIGLNKETLTTIIIDLANKLGLDKEIVQVMQVMQDSRMGIYEYLGNQDDRILLRELTGNEVITCICPAGYEGMRQDELWFVRLLPPVIAQFDYHVVFTTPYVLLNPAADEWMQYIKRTCTNKKSDTSAPSLENLMRYGLSYNYWNEYIFQAYVNHTDNAIYLEGLPDVSSTRPHSTDDPVFQSILPETTIFR